MILLSNIIMEANNKATILIVDDNPNNLQVLGNLLRENNYRIAFAQDGFQAIELAQKILPELILLDVMMPEIDGFQVCENLKSKPQTRSIPVIFLTAKTEHEDILQGFKSGGVDYITKPIKKEELIARVKTHVEFEIARRKLKEALDFKNKIFSIVAHDLRGPIGNFNALLDILLANKDLYSKESIFESLFEIKKLSENIYVTLNNLLLWAKNEMQNITFKKEVFNINETIQKSIDLLISNAKLKNINIVFNVNENILVMGDPETIASVVRNLLSNAIKFSYEGGTVNIFINKDNQYATIIVQDNGIGIPDDAKDKLFSNTNFYTSFGTASEKGIGVGLKLCKSFVEKNGGKIWFETQPGQTKFCFTVPLANPNIN